VEARLEYARVAHARGDFDLALSILDDSQSPHEELRQTIVKDSQERASRASRLKRMRRSGIASVVVLFMSLAAIVWSRQAYETAEERRRTEGTKRQLAESETRRAEAERERAEIEKQRAEEKALASARLADTQKYAANVSKVRGQLKDPRTGWKPEAIANLTASARIETELRDVVELRNLMCQTLSRTDLRADGFLADGFQSEVLAFDHVGKRLFLGQQKKAVGASLLVYDFESRTETHSFRIPFSIGSLLQGKKYQDGFRSIAVSPDDKWLAGGTRHGSIHVWNLNDYSKPAITWKAYADATVVWLKSGPAGLYSRGNKDTLCRWSTAAGTPTEPAATAESVTHVDLVSDGSRLLATLDNADAAHSFRYLDPQSLQVTPDELAAPYGFIVDIPKREGFAIVDESLHLCDTLSLEVCRTIPVPEFAEPDFELTRVTFSPDGNLVAAADNWGHVRLYDVASGELQASVYHSGRDYLFPEFSPDGSRLLIAGEGRVYVHEVLHATLLTPFAAQSLPILSFDVSDSDVVCQAMTRFSATARAEVEGSGRKNYPWKMLAHTTRAWSTTSGELTRQCRAILTRDCFLNRSDEVVFAGHPSGEATVGMMGHAGLMRVPLSPQTGVKLFADRLNAPNNIEVPGSELRTETGEKLRTIKNESTGESTSDVEIANAGPYRDARLRLHEYEIGDLLWGGFGVAQPLGATGAERSVIGGVLLQNKRISLDFGRYLRGFKGPSVIQFGLWIRSADKGDPYAGGFLGLGDARGSQDVARVSHVTLVPFTDWKESDLHWTVNPLSFSADGKHIWGIRDDNAVSCWSYPDLKHRADWRNSVTEVLSGKSTLYCMAPYGDGVIVGGRNGSVSVLRLDESNHVRVDELWRDSMTPPPRIQSCATSKNGRYVVAGTNGGRVIVIDTETGKTVGDVSGHSSHVDSVSMTGRLVASASRAGRVKLQQLDENGLTPLFEVTLSGPVKRLRIVRQGTAVLLHVDGQSALRLIDLTSLNELLPDSLRIDL
jgi:WD40 repeat protein